MVMVTTYHIRIGAIRSQISDMLSSCNSNVCSISQRLRDIRWNNKMQPFWPWKWRSGPRRRRTELAPFDWKCSFLYNLIIFGILATWKDMFTQTGHTHSKEQSNMQNHLSKSVSKWSESNLMKILTAKWSKIWLLHQLNLKNRACRWSTTELLSNRFPLSNS